MEAWGPRRREARCLVVARPWSHHCGESGGGTAEGRLASVGHMHTSACAASVWGSSSSGGGCQTCTHTHAHTTAHLIAQSIRSWRSGPGAASPQGLCPKVSQAAHLRAGQRGVQGRAWVNAAVQSGAAAPSTCMPPCSWQHLDHSGMRQLVQRPHKISSPPHHSPAHPVVEEQAADRAQGGVGVGGGVGSRGAGGTSKALQGHGGKGRGQGRPAAPRRRAWLPSRQGGSISMHSE